MLFISAIVDWDAVAAPLAKQSLVLQGSILVDIARLCLFHKYLRRSEVVAGDVYIVFLHHRHHIKSAHLDFTFQLVWHAAEGYALRLCLRA